MSVTKTDMGNGETTSTVFETKGRQSVWQCW